MATNESQLIALITHLELWNNSYVEPCQPPTPPQPASAPEPNRAESNRGCAAAKNWTD